MDSELSSERRVVRYGRDVIWNAYYCPSQRSRPASSTKRSSAVGRGSGLYPSKGGMDDGVAFEVFEVVGILGILTAKNEK